MKDNNNQEDIGEPHYDGKAWCLGSYALGEDSAIIRLISKGQASKVLRYIALCEPLSSDVALAFMRAGYAMAVAQNLATFSLLDTDVADGLLAEGYVHFVARNLRRFVGISPLMSRALPHAGYEDVLRLYKAQIENSPNR